MKTIILCTRGRKIAAGTAA